MLAHALVFFKLVGFVFAQALADRGDAANQFQSKASELLFQQAQYPGVVVADAKLSQQIRSDEEASVPIDMVVQLFDPCVHRRADQAHRVIPVSYTHLDVYKRQLPARCAGR